MPAKDPARSGNPAVRSGAVRPVGVPKPASGPATTRKRPSQRLILGVLLGAVVVILVATVSVISWQKSHQDPQAPVGQPSFGPVSLTDGKPIVLGHDNAPVTLTLFEDFNCPHCQEFEATLGPTITGMQRAGTVKVELYPMSFVTKRSPALANAMACAATEGFGQAYWVGLFANSGLAWSDDQLITLGSLVGSPHSPGSAPPGFADCVRSQRHSGWVDSITQAAQQQKVGETPTVFINGVRQPANAAWSVADLKSRIGAAK